MITIIHGDNVAQSRTYYIQEREKQQDKVILEGSSLTLTDFLQATTGNGLFGDQQTIFIEDLLSKRKASKEMDELVAAIAATDTPLFLWESKELSAKQLKLFGSATIKVFKIPATVFAFLDSLSPQNKTQSIKLFHQLLETEDANFALFMLQRQVRILLSLSDTTPPVIPAKAGIQGNNIKDPGSKSGMTSLISEVKRLAPWQKGKLEKQAKTFSLQQLLRLHEQLFQLDLAQKTGTLSQPLDKSLDFLLLSL